MELSILTKAMREEPIRRNFFEEALSRIDRVFVREDFNNTEPDADTLYRQFETTIDESKKIEELSERITYLRANIDNMTDKEIISHLNVIEPVFSTNDVSLATEALSTRIRGKAILACEAMDKRVKFALISLIVTAILKAISWLIESLMSNGKAKGKRKKQERPRDLDKDQKKAEEEIREMAKEKVSEILNRKYGIINEITREQMMTLYSYPDEGNLRAPGGRGAGAAAEVISIAMDIILAMNCSVREKEEIRDGVFKCVLMLVSNGAQLGNFAYNEKTRKIIANDLVEFSKRRFQGPISKTMSYMATLMSENIIVQRKWHMDDRFRNGEVRLLTQGAGEDLLDYLDKMEMSSKHIEKFFRSFGGGKSFKAGELMNTNDATLSLHGYVVFDNKDQYDALVSYIRSNLQYCMVNPSTTTAISTPMDLSLEQFANRLEGLRGNNDNSGELIDSKFVSPDAYNVIRRWLDDLSGIDAIETFAKWFYENHGPYDRHDTIQTRLYNLTYSFSCNRVETKRQLDAIKRNFERLHNMSKEISKARMDSPLPPVNGNGFATFVYDLEIPFKTDLILAPDRIYDTKKQTIPLGKVVEGICKTLRDSTVAWGGLMRAIERYDTLAAKIE